MTPETEKYFEEQNIQVYFDTLGKTKALKEAYIESTQKLVDANPTKRSEMVKHACYSQFYSMRQREKLTGFEQFAELDKQYRVGNREYIGEDIFRHSNLFEKSEKSSIILPYKTQLERSYEEYNKPILLYLSGGLDSELVARSLIEFGINFTPVIFNWGNKKGEIVNSNDTQYAFDLCKEFQLTPIVKTVNIDELWLSADFKKLGKAIRILSPQLTTHAYMVELMNAEKPDHIHLLGGEVRYKSNFDEVKTDGFVIPNLVYANKSMPSIGTVTSSNISRTAAITIDATNYCPDNSGGNYGGLTLTVNGLVIYSHTPTLVPTYSIYPYQVGVNISYTLSPYSATYTPGTGWFQSSVNASVTYPANTFSVGSNSAMSGAFYLRNTYPGEGALIGSSSFTVNLQIV